MPNHTTLSLRLPHWRGLVTWHFLLSVAAARTIRQTRQQAADVRSRLRELGETNEGLALARRFRRLRRRFEQGTLVNSVDHEERMDRFAQLTLAVHGLQFSLRREFYPDPSDSLAR